MNLTSRRTVWSWRASTHTVPAGIDMAALERDIIARALYKTLQVTGEL